jgi:hypothetical protein
MDRTEEAVRFPARVVVVGGGGGRDGEEAAIFTVQGEAESGRTSPCEAGERTRYSLAEIFLLPPRLLGSAGLVVVWRPWTDHSGSTLGLFSVMLS